eukprot:s1943_g7.t1
MIPVEEIPHLMCALGYFPTQLEITNMTNEVKYSKFAETSEYVDRIGFDDLVKLYVNHRPVFAVGPEQIKQAFDALKRHEPGPLSREAFLKLGRSMARWRTKGNLLTSHGEKTSLEELERCFEALVGDSAINRVLDEEVDAFDFAHNVLGLAEAEAEESQDAGSTGGTAGGAPHAGRPDGHLAQGKGSPAASPQHVPLHSSARSQAMTNGETQVSSMTRDELLQFVAKLQDALSEAQRSLEQSRLACEAKDENMHQLIYDRNAMQTERDEARLELESLRTQHGVAHRSASQTSLPSAPQSMVVSPGLQPSSSAKCIKADAALPPVPNSWQPPQSARDGKCLSPVSPVSGGPEETEDGDMFPGPDFSGSYRAFGPMATVPQVPAVAPNPGRGTEKLVDILVTVPRANGPEDLDISNYEHFKDHRFHEPSRSLQSLQKNMQPPPPTVQRLPSAPVHSQAYPGQVAFPHVMHHPQFRIVTSASASVPSAPASLAAPAGGVRLAPRPSMVVPQVPANEGCRGDWPNLPSEIGALQGGGAQMARQSRQTQKTGEP